MILFQCSGSLVRPSLLSVRRISPTNCVNSALPVRGCRRFRLAAGRRTSVARQGTGAVLGGPPAYSSRLATTRTSSWRSPWSNDRGQQMGRHTPRPALPRAWTNARVRRKAGTRTSSQALRGHAPVLCRAVADAVVPQQISRARRARARRGSAPRRARCPGCTPGGGMAMSCTLTPVLATAAGEALAQRGGREQSVQVVLSFSLP